MDNKNKIEEHLDSLHWLLKKLKHKLVEDPEYNDREYIENVEVAIIKLERKVKLKKLSGRTL